MSVSRDSAGGRLHPPLLDMLPWSLAAVLVVSLLFVLLNLETMDTGDSLDLWLIRWTRAAGNPERLAGPPLLQESLRDVTALGGYAVLILVSVVFAGFAWVELSRGVCCFFSGTVWGGYFLAVAVKLLVPMVLVPSVPVSASLKLTVKVIASLVMAAVVASVTVLTVGASVSTAWLAMLLRLALARALPAASVRPVPTTLNATSPLARPAVGVTTTV